MSAVLYIVATPIGNLEDITLRAIRTLKEAAVVACEDTRQSRKLLDHYGIQRPLVSYHEHNEAARIAELLDRLRAGESVALISDAGTPLVSDPGYRLVRAAIAEGFPVVPVPGPSAMIAALSASGLPTDSFQFHGFVPAKSGQRRKWVEGLYGEEATVIAYEAPHRILDTLEDIEELLGDRPVVLAREITKLYEEILRGTAASIRAELAARSSVRGEMTLLIGKGNPRAAASDEPPEVAVEAAMREGLSRMEAIKAVAKQRGVPKREIYRKVEK